MNLGKTIRMNRLFANPSGRFLSIAFDHFINYGEGLPGGLRTIRPSIGKIVEGRPDAVTLHKGVAKAVWTEYAGSIPLILQSTVGRPYEPASEQIVEPEEAIRLGADAIAVVIFVKGDTEARQIGALAKVVREASRFDLPVITHTYPRDYSTGTVEISTRPEDIAWAVRCAVEAGSDIVKTPFCGDIAAHSQIVEDCPVPLVAAGGPKTSSIEEALQMISDVIATGARGATVGRNVWGNSKITEMIGAMKAIIHEGFSAKEAMKRYGL